MKIHSQAGESLCAVLETDGHKHLILSPRAYAQLYELVEVLDPFLKAANLTQDEEKKQLLSCVIVCPVSAPSVEIHLHEQKKESQVLCTPVESS